MRMFATGILAASILATQGAETDLLRNWKEFRNVKQDRGSFRVENGIMRMTSGNSNAPFSIYVPLKIRKGISYALSYEMRSDTEKSSGGIFLMHSVKGKKGDTYNAAIENWEAYDGKKITETHCYFFATHDEAWRKISGIRPPREWKRYSCSFLLPESGGKPALIFSFSAPRQSHLEFRNIKLIPQTSEQMPLAPESWENALFESNGREKYMYLSGRVPVSTVIRGIPGKYYRVTYRINNKAATGSLISYDAALLDDGQVLEETVADSSLAGTWLKKNLEARMPQSGRMLLRFFAYHKLWNPGLFILKDFSVTEFIPEKKSSLSITLSEPNYKRTLFASAPHGDIAGKVTDRTAGRKIRVVLTSKADPAREIAASAVSDGFFSLPGTAKLAVGEYLLKFIPEGGKQEVIPIRKVPPNPSEVRYKNGIMYFNNKPFFFSGVWGPPQYKTEAMFYGHARSGIRVQLGSASNAELLLKELDKAQKYHHKLIPSLNFNPSKFREKGYMESWKKHIRNFYTEKVKAHPALLGYYVCDEPGYTGASVEALLGAYQFIDEWDPYHPAWINEAPVTPTARLRKFMSASDAYGVDIYPVPASHGHSGLPDKEVTSVGGFASLFKNLMGDSRPLWMVLQGTAWDAIAERKKPKFPNREQMRFMSFDSIVHGANGNIYWGLWFTRGKKATRGISPFIKTCLPPQRKSGIWKPSGFAETGSS